MDEFPLETTPGIPFMTIVYIILGVFAFIVLVVLIWKLKRALSRPETYGLTREEIAKRWQQVRLTAKQGAMGAKVAVMEADTLLDSALKSISMPGMTLGERLKVACYKYPNLRNVWWAHKLRNQLVHEATFQLSQHQANNALDEFERALKTLNLL